MKISLSIKSKLTILYLLICIALIGISSIAAYFLLSSGLKGKIIHPWDMRYAQLQKTDEGQYLITGFSIPDPHYWDGSRQATVMRSYSRNELNKLSSPEGIISINDILLEKTALDGLNMSEDYSIWFYSDVAGNTVSVVAVTRSANDIGAILETFAGALFIIGPVALVLVGLLGYYIIKRSLHPVQAMTSTVREIEERNLDKRLEVRSNDELGYLASTFNRMLTRLEDAFHRERQFTADVSHELRTPLAVIQGEATLSLSKERDADEYRKSLENIYQETERMSSVLKRLLYLARREDNKQLEFETINLKELLADLVPDVEVLCEDKSIRCQLDATENLFIKGDRLSLRELFFNFIDNAVYYTPQGGEIIITLGKKDHNARVDIRDNGIGIPEEHLKHIFNRFYRVDKSHSRSEGGAGLGLAICTRIAEIHNGIIKVESKVGEGSIFTVFFPLVDSSN